MCTCYLEPTLSLQNAAGSPTGKDIKLSQLKLTAYFYSSPYKRLESQHKKLQMAAYKSLHHWRKTLYVKQIQYNPIKWSFCG